LTDKNTFAYTQPKKVTSYPDTSGKCIEKGKSFPVYPRAENSLVLNI
jgi:hypothetical protein